MDEESDGWIPPSAQPCVTLTTQHEAQNCLKRKNATPEPAATRPVKRPKPSKDISSRPQTERSSQEIKQKPRIRRTIRVQRNGAALPSREIFDPWNVNSNGHQRFENKLSGSASWRDSREKKLAKQFESSRGGGIRVADTVVTGAPNAGKNGSWMKALGNERDSGQKTIQECFKAAGQSKKEKNGVQSSLLSSTLPTSKLELESNMPNHLSSDLCETTSRSS